MKWFRPQEEGGHHDPENVLAARRYCEACLSMGGEWITWDSLAQRVKFFYITLSRRDVMEKSWTQHTEAIAREPEEEPESVGAALESGAPAESAQAPEGTAVKEEPETEEAKKAAEKAEKKRKRDEKDKALSEEQRAAKEQRKSLGKAEGDAKKVLLKYKALQQSVDTAVSSAQKLPEWEWLKDRPAEMRSLDELQKKIDAAKTDLFQRMMIETSAEIRKDFKDRENDLELEFNSVVTRTASRGPGARERESESACV